METCEHVTRILKYNHGRRS
ncbi:unnamed protein product [Oikopleura dioica]|uniref:Uncharacterized protein n=1 Tax=Oikopleura dioica TaxID=34765 RepID=E4Y2X3_OIKDI|nr:unnamed protein product [Oikopleura dioica]